MPDALKIEVLHYAELKNHLVVRSQVMKYLRKNIGKRERWQG
ncbi:MAG: hypothetical protein ACOYN8_03385 [Pseudanabaena sp.]